MDGPLRYPHILRALLARPLAIDPTSVQYAALIDLVVFRSLGGLLTEDQIHERLSAARPGPRGGGNRTGAVAVIPVYGTIGPRFGMLANTSGGTSLDDLGGSIDSALADPAIDAVVLDIDSPGGVVDGIPEFAAKLRAARGQKPLLAIANYCAASAAYWLGTQVDQLFVSPSGSVGSIGVIGAHHDLSAAYEAAGEKVTLITSSGAPFKAEGNKYEALSEEAAAEFLRQADYYEAMFQRDVAKGRGLPIDTVRADFGKGRMLNADDALAAGMVDGIDTLDGVVRLAARTAIAQQRDAQAAALSNDMQAGLGSGLPFSERLALVSAGVRGLVEHASERADMRAKQGRPSISATDRQGLIALADSLTDVAADPEPEAEPPTPTPGPETTPPSPAANRRARVALALAELGA